MEHWPIHLKDFANTGVLPGGKLPTEPKTAHFRNVLRAALEKIAAEDHLTGKEIALFEKIAAKHVTIIPEQFFRDRLSWRYRLKYKNWAAVFSHDLLRIYGARESHRRQFPGDIHRCQREGCPNFFYASERRPDPSTGGKPPTKYCSPDCMLKSQKSSTPRVQRLRAKAKETSK